MFLDYFKVGSQRVQRPGLRSQPLCDNWLQVTQLKNVHAWGISSCHVHDVRWGDAVNRPFLCASVLLQHGFTCRTVRWTAKVKVKLKVVFLLFYRCSLGNCLDQSASSMNASSVQDRFQTSSHVLMDMQILPHWAAIPSLTDQNQASTCIYI